jgi:nucleotide-binding universal stress UspA family protein
MTMITKLLCAIDGSQASVRAVNVAIELSQRARVPLAFLTINRASEERTSKTHFWDDRIIGAVDAQLNKVLADAAAAARRNGLTDFTCIVAGGSNIGAAITAYAQQKGFDHIILGSSRPSGTLARILGSVTAEVVDQATCPITLVR